MEDIILSLEPAFHRVERFLLWHNRYASLIAFAIGHGIFYAIARSGLRPFCAITIVLLILHILDCIKKKRVNNEEQNLSELTQFVLRSYRYGWQTHEQLNTIKTENRLKYSLIIMIICLIFAYIGVKINGFYVSYLFMLILFTLPAIVYHKLTTKLLKRLAPILEQLDQSM
jgi:Flp pilus assembly protein TadB